MTVPDRTEPTGWGGPGPDPEAPGWYRDPDGADQLRYWDGGTWTSRRRPRPTWSNRRTDPEGLAATTLPPRTRSRRKWLILAVAAVVGAVVVGVAGEAMRPKSPGPRVLTDSSYVRLANEECARTLPGLRPPDAGPFGQAIPPAKTAAQIETAAGGLDRLADRLRALPVSAVDRAHVDSWLAGWHRYTNLGRQYAAFLRQRGDANAGSLIATSAREATVADNFARANGLGTCELFATPTPLDPSSSF
jgi:Protein of unknown function (DUF2510)